MKGKRALDRRTRPGQVIDFIDLDLKGNRALQNGALGYPLPSMKGSRALPAKPLIYQRSM
jgi:hypothetical protein